MSPAFFPVLADFLTFAPKASALLLVKWQAEKWIQNATEETRRTTIVVSNKKNGILFAREKGA